MLIKICFLFISKLQLFILEGKQIAIIEILWYSSRLISQNIPDYFYLIVNVNCIYFAETDRPQTADQNIDTLGYLICFLCLL